MFKAPIYKVSHDKYSASIISSRSDRHPPRFNFERVSFPAPFFQGPETDVGFSSQCRYIAEKTAPLDEERFCIPTIVKVNPASTILLFNNGSHGIVNGKKHLAVGDIQRKIPGGGHETLPV